VYFAGYSSETDEAYKAGVLALATSALVNRADIDHICIQSWAQRAPSGTQDIPSNIGQNGLIQTLREVKGQWQ